MSLNDRGAWDSFNPHGAGTFVYLFNYRSRNRHRNLWDRQCVSSRWPLYWFGYWNELYIEIWFTFMIYDCWDLPRVLFVLTDGLWWPALSGHWLSYTGCCQYLFDMKCLMYGLPPYDVSAHGLSFWKTDWTSYHGPPWYHIYILYSG